MNELPMHQAPDPSLSASAAPGVDASDAATPSPTLAAARHLFLPRGVPIRSLGPNHRARMVAHLKALDANDRYLRFGYHALDTHIERYVQSLQFERDEIFGIYNRRLTLIAWAHLALDPTREGLAEFGVSVLAGARGRGYGAALFARAAMHASNQGIERLFIHALSQNEPMLRIAQRAGAVVEAHGMESEATLRLPKATLDSQVSELVEETIAQTDYALKRQAMQVSQVLSELQELRQHPGEPSRKED